MDYKKLKLSDLQVGMVILCKSKYLTNKFIGKITAIDEEIMHLERISLTDFSSGDIVTIAKDSWDLYDMSSLDDFVFALRELFPLGNLLNCFFDENKEEKETKKEVSVKDKNDIKFCWEYYQLDTNAYELYTKAGLPVKIVYYGAKGKYPIVALFEEDGVETPILYDNYGHPDILYWDEEMYLKMCKVIKKKYAGVYMKSDGTIYTTAFIDNRSDIKEIPGSTLIKTIEIEL